METSSLANHASSTLIGNSFAQVAWVVRDIQQAEKFFVKSIGIPRFMKMENLRAQDIEGTYKGAPGDYEFHLYLAYSGETMLELIQPVAGRSIYTDFLDRHGEGGVQHVAYALPEAELDQAVAQLSRKGHSIIQELRLPVARVAYFDTYAAIGVATEIIGVTDEGVQFIEQLKSGRF